MPRSATLAALLIAVWITALAAHAARACSIGSSHASRGSSHHGCGERPACCQDGATAPIVLRIGVEMQHEAPPVAAAPYVLDGAPIVARLPPAERAAATGPPRNVRLHLVLTILVV